MACFPKTSQAEANSHGWSLNGFLNGGYHLRMGQHLLAISNVFLQPHTREIEPTCTFTSHLSNSNNAGPSPVSSTWFNLKATLEHNLLIKINHSVSARNVFRHLYSIFMFAAFLVIFVFAPLVLLLGSLVFHCPRSFVLRLRIFLHIVYLAFILFLRVSSSFSCAWSGLPFNVWVLLVLVFRPYLAIVL